MVKKIEDIAQQKKKWNARCVYVVHLLAYVMWFYYFSLLCHIVLKMFQFFIWKLFSFVRFFIRTKKNVYLQLSSVRTPNQIECEMVRCILLFGSFSIQFFRSFVYYGIYSSARITQSCGEDGKLRRLFHFSTYSVGWWMVMVLISIHQKTKNSSRTNKKKIENEISSRRKNCRLEYINALNCDCHSHIRTSNIHHFLHFTQ